MSTTTHFDSSKPAPDESKSSHVPAVSALIPGWLLILLVFVAGACVLSMELSASRLLAPYFGDTIFVWASLIGLILLYLTIGYYLGGRLADRYHRPAFLFVITGVAALIVMLIPFVSGPLLTWTQTLFASNSLGVFYGSLVSAIALFLLPTILLGSVSPFAIRLHMQRTGNAGSMAGKLYAISTLGSLLGTFLPVFFLLPDIGVAKTFLFSGLLLLLVSLAGLLILRFMKGAPVSHLQAESSETSGTRVAQRGRGPASNLQSYMLIVLVFVEGACSLAVEISASRLLAPYFGTSLFIWANLIGLILLYLTIGYYIGGRFADRYPSFTVLYTLTIIAAFLLAFIPIISRPIMAWSQSSFSTYSIGVFYGSLASVILLFALPVILLSCVSPFAIRLQIDQVGRSGSIAGKFYAISTAGSILGTFLPALVLVPMIGTYKTFFVFAVILLLTSILGLQISAQRGPGIALSARSRVRLLAILLLIPMAWSIFAIQGPIKPADGSNGGGTLLTEEESAYNYIQVVKVGNQVQLVLNEGVGIHSVYDPNNILTGAEWDYYLDAPYFNNPPFTPQQVHSVCIIGLGAGTIARELTAAYGPIAIDGVELDGEIIKLGQRYFDMNEPNLNVINQDGRYYLATTQKKYDEIAIDAYQQPYVPFQLTTREFFQLVRAHLTPTGVVAINAGRTDTDFRLVEALAQTMRSVFPNVYIINPALYENSIIIGTNEHTAIQNFSLNTLPITNSLLQAVATSTMQVGNLREEPTSKVWFTDDQAPVEQLIDSIILGAIANNGN